MSWELGRVKGTIISPSALCDIVRAWGCTTGKHLDHFRVCILLCASSLYSCFLASCTLSWCCWFMTQLHFSQQSLWQGFAEEPIDSSCADSCPVGLCWRHCSTLRSAISCYNTVTACCVTAHVSVAGFSGWFGKGALLIATDISQPNHADCECLMDL